MNKFNAVYATFVALFKHCVMMQAIAKSTFKLQHTENDSPKLWNSFETWKKNNKEDHPLLAVLGIGHITPLLVFLLSVLQIKAWYALLISFP